MKLVQSIPECNIFFSEMVKYFRNGSETLPKWLKTWVFKLFWEQLQDRDAVAHFWSSPHPMFGRFRLVPYSTVANLINQLDDQLFNSLPKQPEGPVRSKSPKKSKDKPGSSSTSSSNVALASSKPTPQTTLTDQPPADNPLEEPNIWTTILKLEGRVHQNKVSEGFQYWLRKNIDSSLFEVQKCSLLPLYTPRKLILKKCI